MSAVAETELEVDFSEPEGVVHGRRGAQSPLLSEPAAKVDEPLALAFDFATQGLRHGAFLPRCNCGRSSARRWSKMRFDLSS